MMETFWVVMVSVRHPGWDAALQFCRMLLLWGTGYTAREISLYYFLKLCESVSQNLKIKG